MTIAEFKLTLIKGHTKENNYDGYGPHHHWELVNVPVEEYLRRVNSIGLVYPDKSMADLILSPWQVPWIRENVQLTSTGYDFLTEVDEQYKGRNFYAFGDYHDGIDGMPSDLSTGRFIKRVEGGYTNGNGKRPTADIFEVTLDSITELWQTKQGTKALDALTGTIVLNPKQWKKSLGEPVQQWLFWSIVERLNGGK